MSGTLSAALADITLPDTEGETVRLGALWDDGPAVLVFLRHYGWLFCREHVAQLRDHTGEIESAGASVAAVGLGDAYYGKTFKEKSGIGFPLLIDEDRQAYGALGLKVASPMHLLRRDNNAARKRAQAGGFRQGRLGKNPFQLGGSFVFGPGNVDLFAHVSETFGDNAAPKDLIAALG